MSAYTMRYLACDFPHCVEQFRGRAANDGTSESTIAIQKRARAAGWTHPDGWTHLCLRHKRGI